MPTRKLRIGLLVETRDLLAWECAMLRRVMKSQYAELVLFIHNNAESANHGLHRRRTIATLFSTAIRRMTYALLAKLEEKVGGCDPYALAVCNDLEQFRSIPCLEVTPSAEPFTAAINPFDVERIREFDVDVFIKLGDFPLERDILRVANYGVWSVVHTDNRVNRGGAAGFWEVFHNVPVTASTLQLLRETPDDKKVIGRSRLGNLLRIGQAQQEQSVLEGVAPNTLETEGTISARARSLF